MDKSDLPETAVPIGQGWDGKIKRDEEKHNEKELADKGAVKKSKWLLNAVVFFVRNKCFRIFWANLQLRFFAAKSIFKFHSQSTEFESQTPVERRTWLLRSGQKVESLEIVAY